VITISGTVTNGVILTGAADSPLTITPTGQVVGAGLDVIYGAPGGGQTWTVVNQGVIKPAQNQVVGVAPVGPYAFPPTPSLFTPVPISPTNGSITATKSANIFLPGGGTVVNSGTITGAFNGVVIGSSAGTVGSVSNYGTIYAFNGISLNAGGTVTNSGQIMGVFGGSLQVLGAGSVTNFHAGFIGGMDIVTFGASDTITNFGTINASNGVFLESGGTVINGGNGSSGLIESDDGVQISGGTGIVKNMGTIEANFNPGVFLVGGGSVTNLASGSGPAIIRGTGAEVTSGVVVEGGGNVINGAPGVASDIIVAPRYGVCFYGSQGTVTNFGTIESTDPDPSAHSNSSAGLHAGVFLSKGGALTNASTDARIEGLYGVRIQGGSGTVTNFGVIEGGRAGVLLNGGGTLTNAGTIIGNNGTAVLFGGSNNRMVVDPGAVFIGTVDGGGSAGSNTLELAAGAGTGTLAGLGTSFVDFGTVVLDAGAIWTVTLPTAFTGTISGFAPGDIIDLTGLAATGLSYSGGTLTVLNGGSTVATLNLLGSYSSGDFYLRSDGNGGTEIGLGAPPPVATSDFNGDGKSDILFQNTNGQAAVWLINGTAPFSEPLVGGNPGPSWQAITARDFNGDGDADILFQNTNGQPAIWLMNGATPFSEVTVGANPGPSWHVIGAGDFNGDGDADILFQNTNGQPAIWLMNSTTPFSEVTVGANPGLSWRVVGTGDFNGDHDSDILFQNDNGQAAIWLMNGTTPFSEVLVGANPGPSWHIVGVGDFNGDGDSDILFQNDNGQAAIWLMNGTTPFSEVLVGANPGPSWHIVGVGDFNGDGDSDILWQNDNGQASIWLMNGTTPTAEVLVDSNPGATWHIHAAS
jgi:hypothetical protein